MSGGGKNQTSTTKVTIPPEVLAQYKKATDMASTAAERPWQSYSSDPSAFVAGMTPTQMAGIENINENAQAAQPWYQGAGGATVAGMGSANLGGLNVDQYMSPYLRNVAQTTSDLLGQQNEQAMSGQLGNAITSGAAWGDRSGIAAANLNRQQTMSSANILSNLLNQGYTQAQGVAQQQQGADLAARQANLARLMQGGMNLGQLGTGAQAAALQGGQAQMAAGQQEQQTEQARLSAMYNQWLQQQAYPFQTAQFFSNIAQGIGANSGSTTSLTQPAGFFSGLARGGRAGKADGGGLGTASMGGHVGMEHAMQGYADGGMPQDYSAMVLQALFGGGNPNAGAYGMAGGLPGGGAGFVPQPNMQAAVLRPAEMPEPTDQTSVSDVVNAAEKGADIYNSEGGQRAGRFVKDLLGYDNPMQQASGGRIGYGLGGTPYESSATSSMGGLPSPGGGYVPPPIDNQSSDKLKPAELAPQEQESGLGKIADMAKIATMFFLKDGGVAGPRHGYDAGGAPSGESWEDWIQKQAARLGLAEDRPVSEIRSEAYGDATPQANFPQYLNTGPSTPPIIQGEVIPSNAAPAAKPPAPVAGPGPAFERTGRGGSGLAAAGTTPAATSGDMTDFLNDVQEQSQAQAKDIWSHAFLPDTPRAMSALDMGAAALAQGAGVYLPGAVNYLFGDPTRANPISGPNESPAPAAPPAGGVAPAAAAPAEQRQIPQVFGDAGMSYTPTLPRPGLAAAAEPAATGAGPGPVFERAGRGAPGLAAATNISPVTQMTGTPVGDRTGLELYQFNAANDEGTNKINFGDPNGGTLAGFHLGQYKSIDPSIRSLGDVQPHHIRDAQAKWWRENGGDAIQAKYGPEFAASYVNLSMLNPNMAKAALAQAGGDKAGFFDIMGQKLANLGQNPKYAPNVKGWLGRVDRNKRFALNEGPTEMPAGGQIAATSSDESPALALAGADISAPATSNVPQIRQAAGEVGGDTGRGIGGIGNWFRKNENALLPILSGIGAMASSPSRYLGSAILQGVGAGAGSYMKRQGQLADIANKNSLTLNNLAQVFPNSMFTDQKGLTWVQTTDPNRPRVTMYEFASDPSLRSPFGEQATQAIRSLYANAPANTSGEPSGAPGGFAPPSQPGAAATVSPILSQDDIAAANAAKQSRVVQGASGFVGWFDMAPKVQETSAAAIARKPSVDETMKTATAAIAEKNTGSFANAYASMVLKPLETIAARFNIDTTKLFGDAPTQQILLQKLQTMNAGDMTADEGRAASVFKAYAEAFPNLEMTPAAIGEITAMLKINNQRDIDQNVYLPAFAVASGGNMLNAMTTMENHYNYRAEKEAISTIMQAAENKPNVAEFLKLASAGTFQNKNQVNMAMKIMFADDPEAMKLLERNPLLYRYFTRSGIEGR
jgi:hypothetical protein